MNNPSKLKGIQFDTGIRTYYTANLREYDAGLLFLGHTVNPWSLLVPPKTNDYVISGHCSSKCTAKVIPPEGVNVFSSLLHAHSSGRKLKVRQFRNGEELPWFDNDDAYDFNYQQNKPFREYRRILPGDHLTVECTDNSKWHPKGLAIPGGLSSRNHEMCQAFVLYYPAKDLATCDSSVDVEMSLSDFGITQYQIENINGQDKIVIEEPKYLRGPYEEAVSFKDFRISERISKKATLRPSSWKLSKEERAFYKSGECQLS